ncbi:MAG: endonuclease III [Bacteriovoracaceae bacterium]|nr:endonuclease III [Bacteriovoracaceae bacterium]
MKKSDLAAVVYERLKKVHPDAHCELNHSNPFELLLATILSAQCTDARVNIVTPALFKRFPTPEKLAKARLEEVEDIIKSINFFRNKSKSLIGCAQMLVEKHQSDIPRTVEELSELPGVGRKTANVVLGNAFNINTGIVVDTHVKRTAHLLGLTKQTDPVKVEIDLMKLFPNEQWTDLSHLLIFLGRRTCVARRPQCDLCNLKDVCASKDKLLKASKKAPRDTKSKVVRKAASPK